MCLAKKMSKKQKHFAIACKTCKISNFYGECTTTLEKGTLLEIIKADQNKCDIKIHDFNNQYDGLNDTYYDCNSEDLLRIDSKLWPYLISITNFNKRLKFVLNLSNGNAAGLHWDAGFKIGDMVEMIGSKFDADKNLLFKIVYRGIVPDKGLGFYFGIVLENLEDLKFIKGMIEPYYIDYTKNQNSLLLTADLLMLNSTKLKTREPEKLEGNIKSFAINNERNIKINNDFFSVGVIPMEIKKTVWSTNKLSIDNENRYYNDNWNNDNSNAFYIDMVNTNAQPNAHNARNNSYKEIFPTALIKCNSNDNINDLCKSCRKEIQIITLQSCKHEVCRECLVITIKKCVESGIKCPVSNCESDLNDFEIKSIGGDQAYAKIVENRLAEIKRDNAYDLFTCFNPECGLAFFNESSSTMICCLKCGKNNCTKCKNIHSEYETCNSTNFLMNKTENNNILPFINNIRCEDSIKDPLNLCDIIDIPVLQNENEFKCLMCTTTIGVQNGIVLSQCKHEICRDCIERTLNEQTSNSAFGKCPFCFIVLTDDEIKILGGPHIYDSFMHRQSIKNYTVFQGEIGNDSILPFINDNLYDLTSIKVLQNEQEFKCLMCTSAIGVQNGIVLRNCKHEICRSCIKSTLEEQALNLTFGKCPSCLMVLTDDEIKVLGGPYILAFMLQSIKNDTKFEEKIGNNNKLPFINDCQNDKNIKFPLNLCARIDIPILQNENEFKCLMCTTTIEVQNGVVLSQCKHEICRDCITKTLEEQTSNSAFGKCPICFTVLTDDEITIFGGPHIYDLFMHRQSIGNNSLIKEKIKCLNLNCDYWCAMDCNVESTTFKCPSCLKLNCLKCQELLHQDYSICDHSKKIKFSTSLDEIKFTETIPDSMKKVLIEGCRNAKCGGVIVCKPDKNQGMCTNCNSLNCFICKAIHDNLSCNEYKKRLKKN